MKTVVICLLLGCRAEPPAALPMGPAQGGGSGVRSEVREVWDPACLMAIRELKGIGDPDEFERAAMAWLEIQEPYVALQGLRPTVFPTAAQRQANRGTGDPARAAPLL